MTATSVIEWAGGIGAVACALVATAAAIERVFSPLGKFIQRWVTAPLVSALDEFKAEVSDRFDVFDRRMKRLEEAHDIEDV